MGIIYKAGEDPVIQIANEFTVVQLAYIRTGKGERLVVTSPKLGFETQLDPLQLECLTWQPSATFSRLLETPYGPGSEMRAKPLSTLMRKE